MKEWSGEEHIVELEDNNDITNYSKIEKSNKNNYDNKYEKKRKKKEIIKF